MEITIYTTWILIPKVINVYEKRRFILLFVDDTFMYMIITDLFDIDIHIFTVIKFLYNLVVKFKYIWFIFSIVDDILCKW